MRRTVTASPGIQLGDARLVTDRRASARKLGWNRIDVEGEAGSPAFCYTVGMGAKNLPDLLLIWDADKAARTALLEAVAAAIVKRRGPVPEHFEPLGPGRVRLNRVYDEEFFEKCPLAQSWNAMHGIRRGSGLQIVLADENGRYPD